MASKTVVAFLCGIAVCVSGGAWAQEYETPPGGGPLLRPLPPFKELQIRLDSALFSLEAMGGLSNELSSDLYATNSLLESTNHSIAELAATTSDMGLLTDDLSSKVVSLEASYAGWTDECADESWSCSLDGEMSVLHVDDEDIAISCYPYTCGGHGTCQRTCGTDADCSGDTHCNGSGQCVRYGSPQCKYVPGKPVEDRYRYLLSDGMGQLADCAPYVCDPYGSADHNAAGCKTSCTTTEDCAAGFLCDTAMGRCI